MSMKRDLLINHICKTIKELAILIATIELGDLSEKQIIEGINKNAELLKLDGE